MKRVCFIFVVVALLAASCSAKRNMKTDASQQSETRSYLQREAGIMQADTLREMWLHRNDDLKEALVLSPVGAFRFHPDSGFSGEASQVILYRQKSIQEDALNRVKGRHVSRLALAVTDSSRMEKRNEASHRSVAASTGTGWLWWMAGVCVVLLAFLAWLLLKRFRL